MITPVSASTIRLKCPSSIPPQCYLLLFTRPLWCLLPVHSRLKCADILSDQLNFFSPLLSHPVRGLIRTFFSELITRWPTLGKTRARSACALPGSQLPSHVLLTGFVCTNTSGGRESLATRCESDTLTHFLPLTVIPPKPPSCPRVTSSQFPSGWCTGPQRFLPVNKLVAAVLCVTGKVLFRLMLKNEQFVFYWFVCVVGCFCFFSQSGMCSLAFETSGHTVDGWKWNYCSVLFRQFETNTCLYACWPVLYIWMSLENILL